MIQIEEVSIQRPQPMFGPKLPPDRPVERWLKVRFAWRKDLVEKVKAIPGAMWSVDGKCWLVPDAVREHLKDL